MQITAQNTKSLTLPNTSKNPTTRSDLASDQHHRSDIKGSSRVCAMSQETWVSGFHFLHLRNWEVLLGLPTSHLLKATSQTIQICNLHCYFFCWSSHDFTCPQTLLLILKMKEKVKAMCCGFHQRKPLKFLLFCLSVFLKDIIENHFKLFYVSPDFLGKDYVKIYL